MHSCLGRKEYEKNEKGESIDVLSMFGEIGDSHLGL